MRERADYVHFALNSVIISFGATLLAIADRGAGGLRDGVLPGPRTKDLLLWMLSTKMMPAVGVLIPIYLLFRDFGALDTRIGLIVVYTLMNLPIVVWMLYTFFKEVPKDILEAGRMDGARPQAGGRPPADAAVAARASRRPRCCRSSCAGTRRSGAST